MSLDELKNQWNQVLDYVESRNRIAWLAFFDARLVSLSGDALTLSFIDAEKLGGKHDFKSARNPEHIALLQEAIKSVVGINLEIVEL